MVGGDVDPSFASRLRMRWWADAITEIFDNVTMELDEEESTKVCNGGMEPRYPHPLTTTSTTTLQFSSSSSLQGRSGIGMHSNPTLRSLRRAIREHQLTHRFLRRMTEAREFDLDVVQHDRLRDAAQYGEDTVSNMLYSTLECVGVSLCMCCHCHCRGCTLYDFFINFVSLKPEICVTNITCIGSR